MNKTHARWTLSLLLTALMTVIASYAIAAPGDTLLHNATNLGSSKSGGDWGLPGGMYGQFTCATCHTKTTNNVKRVVESIPATIGPNVIKTVTFNNMTAFGDDSAGHATSVRVCEVCHTQTKYHQYNTANAPQSGNLTHPNGNCMACHPHSNGFKATGCTACHDHNLASGKPIATGKHSAHINNATVLGTNYGCADCHAPTMSSDTVFSNADNHDNGSVNLNTSTCTAVCHTDGKGGAAAVTVDWTTGPALDCKGCHGGDGTLAGAPTYTTGNSHAKHVTGVSDCISCHYATTETGTTIKGSHTNGTIDVSSSYGIGYASGTCSSTSCHANPYGTGSVTTPAWGVAAAECTACHSAYPIKSTGPQTGSHAKHNETDCTLCHAAGTTATTAPTLANGHTDGNIDVTGGYPANVTKHAKGSYTGTCSTATCHDNGTGSTVTTPVWGSTPAACTACHAASPTTGSHSRHMATTLRKGILSISCGDCHTNAVAGSNGGDGHLDGNVDIISASGYPQNITKHASGSYSGSCSTVYCHSNGSTTARTITYKSIAWNVGTLDCEGCHPTINLSAGHSAHISTLLTDRKTTLSYSNYSANGSAGTDYKFGCANCHPVDITKHIDGNVDVDVATKIGSGNLKGKNPVSASYDMANSKKCDNVYCHSNGYATGLVYAQSPAWTGTFAGDKCAGCHGNSPSASGQIAGSSAHAAHVVGIHDTNIYSGTSGKLVRSAATGGAINAAHGTNSRATTINCNICHNETIQTSANDENSACVTCHTGLNTKNPTSLISNTSFHVNGQVNVKFADTKIVSKAQVNSSSFNSYTAASEGGWTRNKGLYKNFTSAYDVTKTTLFSTAGFSAGDCTNVACHAGKQVKWTDTISCNNCHTRL